MLNCLFHKDFKLLLGLQGLTRRVPINDAIKCVNGRGSIKKWLVCFPVFMAAFFSFGHPLKRIDLLTKNLFDRAD